MTVMYILTRSFTCTRSYSPVTRARC
jgi:hypothetical protein